MKTKPPIPKIRNKEVTRKKILDTAFWLFYSNSFNSISFDHITKATRLTKGALYHYFSTKNELGYAVIDEVLKPITIQRWITPLEKFDNALEGILNSISTNMVKSPKNHIALGCPLNNLIQEVSNTDPIFRKKLSEVLELWTTGIEFHLKRSKKLGYIHQSVDTKCLAKFIVLSQEGAYGMSKGYNSSDAFKIFHRSLKQYFKTIAGNG